MKSLDPSQATMTRFRRELYAKCNTKTLAWAITAMLISYFYNLPVLTYSAIGENQFRLYDVAGMVIMFCYMRNYEIITTYIESQKLLYSLHVFLLYAAFTLIFSAIGSILANKFIYILQCILYLFHFWTFFLCSVFLSILIHNKSNLKKFVTVLFTAAIIAFLIVILQNFGVIGFLWNDVYKEDYDAFLSGTFGPNKVVLGMSSLLIMILGLGLLNEKRVKFNKFFLLVVVGLATLTLILSGSRTAYLGVIVFLLYFSLKQTLGFLYSILALFFIVVVISMVEPEIVNKALVVFENRVESKIENPEAVENAEVGELYKDLGAGRDRILIHYLKLLADEYYYIPLGRGFDNRIATSSSAHNMYLSLIYEVGIIGMVLYFRWLVLYLFVDMKNFPMISMALKGLILSMMVTLFFGEHLYIYRPLFALLGLFLFVVTILTSPLYILDHEEEEKTA